MLTETVQLEIIRNIAPAIVAIGTLLGVLFTAFLTYKNGKKSDEIHLMVNGNLEYVRKELKSSMEQIVELKSHIVSLKMNISDLKGDS